MQHQRSPQISSWRSLEQLTPYFAVHRPALWLIAALAAAQASLAALEPLAVKHVFDAVVSRAHVQALAVPVAGLLFILLGAELLSARLDWLVWRVRLLINHELLHALVERLHSLPLSYHREGSVGATMTRVERGISGCMSAFSEVFQQLVPALFYLGISIVVMVRLDWRLSLVVALFAPIPPLLAMRASREQVVREHALLERWAKIFARFNEVLTGIVVVKSFVMEEQEKRRFIDGVAEANATVLSGVATDARNRALNNAVLGLARVVALLLGGVLVMRHEISLGTLVAFISYLGGVFRPLQTLTGMYQSVQRATVSLDSVASILDAQDSLGDAPDARELRNVRGEVRLRQLGFEYRPGVNVLHQIDLHVKPGEMIALVGPSGAGKSTMMALLQRLYDPTSGSISIDGHDLRELKQRSLRSEIGVVLQDGMLFSDSVRDNIAFGSPHAQLADIEAAARAANAHDFIMALPHGYDTLVGERGSKLSGGERQRIAIARALLKNAPILILDEATSALDAESEEKVQEALSQLMHGRTAFVIAHRLSTIVSADRIAVFKDGTIAELGKHDELMRAGGYYASLVHKQTRALSRKAA